MKKVIFISSEGGHLSELQQLEFNDYDYQIVTERTTTTNELRKKYKNKIHYLLYGTRRTPFIYFFILLINSIISLNLFIKYKPDYVVSTGTHTAVPMCFIAKLFKKKVIWIETFANRTTATLAGKIVYKIADTFVVQWEEMKSVYPKAEYWGAIF